MKEDDHNLACRAFRPLQNAPASAVILVREVLGRRGVGWNMRVFYNEWLVEKIIQDSYGGAEFLKRLRDFHPEKTMWYSVSVPSMACFTGVDIKRFINGRYIFEQVIAPGSGNE